MCVSVSVRVGVRVSVGVSVSVSVSVISVSPLEKSRGLLLEIRRIRLGQLKLEVQGYLTHKKPLHPRSLQ